MTLSKSRGLPIGIRAWPLRAGLTIVVVAVIGYFLYRTTDVRPDERDRAMHPDGYSMVGPHGWPARRERDLKPPALDRLIFQPDEHQWKGLTPSVWVRRLSAAPDDKMLEGYAAGQFQTHPAQMRDRKLKHTTVRTALVERGDNWYEIGVELPGLEALKMNDWWRFAETFRTEISTNPSTKSL